MSIIFEIPLKEIIFSALLKVTLIMINLAETFRVFFSICIRFRTLPRYMNL